MNNNDMVINEKEEESYTTEENDENNVNTEKESNLEESEKEINLNECQLNISTNSDISSEKQVDNDNSSKEIITITQFRNLLGILGHKSTNFIIERLYQALIKITSKKKEQLSPNLTNNQFLNYLSIINGTKVHHEIFYLFFDISNKGYVSKNDFINVVNNMCETICEFNHKNPLIYKESIANLYDHLLQINMRAVGCGDNNQQWISKSSFMRLIENDAINFYEIMNTKNFENKITITQDQYRVIKDIMYSIKAMRKKITQKQNIETKLSIITDNYLDNINSIKDEYKEIQIQNEINNNSLSLGNNSSLIDKQMINESISEIFNYSKNKNNQDNNNILKNFTFNKSNNLNKMRNLKADRNFKLNNKANSFKNLNNSCETLFQNFKPKSKFDNNDSNSFISSPKMILYNKIKSPQERMNNDKNLNNGLENEDIDEISLNSINSGDEDNEKDEEINYELLEEENEDSVCEMDNNSIKMIQNIKKSKKNLTKYNARENPLNKNRKKNFFFLKPFQIKNDKELQKELKNNNIDINDTLILLKKENFLSYLNTLEECFFKEVNDINKSSNISNLVKETQTSIILNKPLKEKEIYQKEISFNKSLNNINMELMVAIIVGVQKCIHSLGDYELIDKNVINLFLLSEETHKTSRKRKNTLFPLKVEKKDSDLQETLSNYPFKKNDYIFEETHTFHYSFYGVDKKKENNINLNKIEITEYAPLIFCNIRYNLGETTNKEYLLSFNIESLISNILFGMINNLSELITINKDNFPEFIMFSSDTKYIIKCITQTEFEVLHKILPNYYDHLIKCIIKNLQKNNSECRSSTIVSTFSSSGFNQINNNIESKCTLLDIIYGIYSINFFNKKLYFIIKKNIFYSYKNLLINKKYDLKGSSIDRKSKARLSDVFKDLDFLKSEQKLNLSPKISSYLSEILEKDTLFLSKNNIINYSFYIGIADIKEAESFENEENEEGILSLDKNNMYYFGISDIFMEYNTGKKVEHIFKKITKGSGISVVPPDEYKNRFDNFIKLCLK